MPFPPQNNSHLAPNVFHSSSQSDLQRPSSTYSAANSRTAFGLAAVMEKASGPADLQEIRFNSSSYAPTEHPEHPLPSEHATGRYSPLMFTESGGHRCNSFKFADERRYRNDIYPDLEASTEHEDEQLHKDDDEDIDAEPEFQPIQADECERRQGPVLQDLQASEIVSSSQKLFSPPRGDINTNEGNNEDLVRDDTYNGMTYSGHYSTADPAERDSPLHQLLHIWKSRLNLTAVVAIVGSVRYTVQQYEFTREMLRDNGANPTWPSYATTHGYFQRVIEICLPKSDVVNLSKTSVVNRSGQNEYESSLEPDSISPNLKPAHVRRTPGIENLGTEKVRIFLPSARAKLDVATAVVFEDMFPHFGDNCRIPNALETSYMIRDRESITQSCSHIYASTGGLHAPCKGGTEVTVSVQNPQPTFENSFRIEASDESYVLHASISATWSVGNEKKRNGSAESSLNNPSLSAQKRAIISSLSTAFPPSPVNDDDINGIIPGDICPLLNSELGDTDLFPVIIHRYWRYDDGLPSVTISWMRLTPPASRTTVTDGGSIECLATHIVGSITTDNPIRSTTSPDQGTSHGAGARSCGILKDDTPFVIYRILLYCDDFQRSSAMCPKGSAGGCYFLPVSLPPETRRSRSSVRLISLTPPGISTNQVLKYIVKDVVNASVHGVRGYTPTGQPVKIFIDVVGFVSDYPASASVVDVVGHVGNNPCTVCSFRRLPDSGTEGFRFGYTTNVHANNSAFMRHGERHHSLRESGITDEHAKILGMVGEDRFSDNSCPLLHLQREMRSQKSRSALTSDGVPVVSNSFDAFRCNVIAPDHLLTGLSKDVLNAMFRLLPKN